MRVRIRNTQGEWKSGWMLEGIVLEPVSGGKKIEGVKESGRSEEEAK